MSLVPSWYGDCVGACQRAFVCHQGNWHLGIDRMHTWGISMQPSRGRWSKRCWRWRRRARLVSLGRAVLAAGGQQDELRLWYEELRLRYKSAVGRVRL